MNPNGWEQNPWLWLNGQFLRESEARISPLDRGLQFGDGVFETLRVEKGRPLYLEKHLRRMLKSLDLLRIPLKNSPDWAEILQRLTTLNAMESTVAAAKILVTRGEDPRMGLPPSPAPTLCCLLRPFTVPGEDVYENGCRLHLCREGYSPPLAHHKSLNYLYFQMARQAALDRGKDDSIILDCEGNITETSIGAILIRIGSQWLIPASPHRLPSTTLETVCVLLQESGENVCEQPIMPTHLEDAETLWVLNALLGIMPAREVDDRPVPELRSDLARDLRALWLLGGR